jgi:predicted adenylyl cyclase CyaB
MIRSSSPSSVLNVEVKARLADPARARAALRAAGAVCKGTDRQVDTYFRCPRGRLKLREGDIENALIHYHRPDEPGPKPAQVTLYAAPAPARLRELLTRALGVRVTVAKARVIHFLRNVKVHVDDVAGLGTFLEIEAVDADGTIGAARLLAQCRDTMRRLGVRQEDLLRGSYSDMMLGRPPGQP